MLENFKKYYLLIFVVFLFLITIFLFYLDFQSLNKRLTFAMLDVGQGDGLFI